MAATENFRDNLRSALEFRGLTQRALAKKSKVGYPYLNRVLKGKTDPSVAQCERLAKGVKFRLSELLESPKKFSECLLTPITR